MSKRIWFVVTFVILIAMLIYKIPTEINRNLIWGTISSVNGKANKEVKISVKGELRRNLLSRDTFSGVIIVDGNTINVSTPVPANLKMRVEAISDKLSGMPIEVIETQVIDGMVRIRGQAMFSRDFDLVWGYSDTLREKYNDDELSFEGSMDINDFYQTR